MIDFKKYPLPKRWRHHVAPYLYFAFNKNNPKPETYPELLNNIDWAEVYKSGKSPDCLDIGSAWSRFLMRYALENKDENILGVEVRRQTVNYAQDVIEKESVSNAHVLWYSMANGLDFIENNSVSKIFYFFPDPWFKERHKKRRAFGTEMIKECHRMLRGDGRLYLQSDIEEVHTFHKEELEKSGIFTFYEPKETEWNLPTTDKEEDCLSKNIQYWRLIAEKVEK
jgi:tRNA (guanine-N7-)-methyltransferase